jgi:hypothetical protein
MADGPHHWRILAEKLFVCQTAVCHSRFWLLRFRDSIITERDTERERETLFVDNNIIDVMMYYIQYSLCKIYTQ